MIQQGLKLDFFDPCDLSWYESDTASRHVIQDGMKATYLQAIRSS